MSAVAPARRRAGFTLVELGVVLALLAIVATLALPALGHTMARQRMKAAAETLALDLAEARHEAARRATPLHLTARPGPSWCYAVATRADCGCETASPCALKTVRADDLPGVTLEAATPAAFDPAGTPQTPASAEFAGRGGERLRVVLMPLGRARVCAPAAPVAGYPPC